MDTAPQRVALKRSEKRASGHQAANVKDEETDGMALEAGPDRIGSRKSSLGRNSAHPQRGENIEADRAGQMGALDQQPERGTDVIPPMTRVLTPAVQRVVEWHLQREVPHVRIMAAHARASAMPSETLADVAGPLSEVGEEDPGSALGELPIPKERGASESGQAPVFAGPPRQRAARAQIG